jgi:Tfp pilus assembly protein PilX
MHSHTEKQMTGNHSEGGFVLIVALLGIMILLAVGYFALMVSTSDLRIVSRLVGEQKALSAAEAGVHACLSNYSSAPTANNVSNRAVDSVNDPYAFYDVTDSTEIAGLSQACSGAFSIEGGVSWHCKNFRSLVTGRNTWYGSTTSIQVGVKGRATPDTPNYDFN